MDTSQEQPKEQPTPQDHTLVDVINEVNSAPVIRQRLIK